MPPCLRLGLTLALEVTMAHAVPVSHCACAPLVPQPPWLGVDGLSAQAELSELTCTVMEQPKVKRMEGDFGQTEAGLHPGAPFQGL